ncbi:LytR/AlgR family response regulator transcription factor [Marinicella meishanensis]|uniref:LytR/AlgR family response regulator transcription factor n=1 Tax=Marinicella meishanensis TaxID=2873263 RepID=UPI001CC176EF|nr:LytTR family DNA-binding domain-containing protein [Marinicella sp. NBU2979]
MTRAHIDRPSNQALLWMGLVLFTTLYYFAYDRLYLSRDVLLLETLIGSLKAWAIWLLLMPLILHHTPPWHSGQRVTSHLVQNLLLWMFLGLAVSTTYQAWVFNDVPNLGSTLLFCYFPANLKILAVVMALKMLGAKQSMTLSCQDHRNQTSELSIRDISHCSSDGNYLQLHSADRTYTTRSTLSAMAQRLQSHGFIQIHRRHLINMTFVRERNSQYLTLKTGVQLPIGRSFKSAIP